MSATTVLAGKGTLRRANSRRALDLLRAVAAMLDTSDGRLRRDHEGASSVDKVDHKK